AYVCEDLGTGKQRVTAMGLKALSRRECSPLTTLILIRKNTGSDFRLSKPALGIGDGEFYRREPKAGLITKQEVRAVSLAKLRIAEDDIVWDIGAGSGALSIEASFLARSGHVYAVEKDDEDVVVIRKNIARFGVSNVTVVHAFAPDGLGELPDPSAVFIGGSGGRMVEIIGAISRRLGHTGRLVINVATLESLGSAVEGLKAHGFSYEITLLNIARSKSVIGLTRLEALNPVFVIAAGCGRRENDAC
ncbi:MAG: precorrin-6Y C5,15-methyltransferase (decarboxylating) subunit CbiT, partial [Dehalococcoidales bacterium]|nr:precorrin-6Y C5,15-methyltransferase (decarboxylating) subunit CbiT [Dehalococcoidales bacterium]